MATTAGHPVDINVLMATGTTIPLETGYITADKLTADRTWILPASRMAGGVVLGFEVVLADCKAGGASMQIYEMAAYATAACSVHVDVDLPGDGVFDVTATRFFGSGQSPLLL